MPARHLNHDGSLGDGDKTGPVTDENFSHVEIPGRALRYASQLIFGHGRMGFVLNSSDGPASLARADDAPKNYRGAGAGIVCPRG